jgi:hypothetical protein
LNTLTAPTTVNRPAQVMSATRKFYDDPSFNTAFPQTAAPTKGDVTMLQAAVAYSAGALQYQTQSRAVYDGLGRATGSYDADGYLTSMAYAMNSVGLPIGITITNPMSQTASTTFVPTRGAGRDPDRCQRHHHYPAVRHAGPGERHLGRLPAHHEPGQPPVHLSGLEHLHDGRDDPDAARRRRLRHGDADLRRAVPAPAGAFRRLR